jgi:energy-converting hydrogenase Eha subunit B
MFVLGMSAGGLAALLVYVGDAFCWPHFNRREGYFGTDFISSLLYAIGDPHAIHIVAVLWFSYAASFVFIL